MKIRGLRSPEILRRKITQILGVLSQGQVPERRWVKFAADGPSSNLRNLCNLWI